jgi:hypothetical protein
VPVRRRIVEGQMSSRLAVTIGGMYLLLLFLPGAGRSEHPPLSGCPPLAEQGATNTVSLYVAKALDVQGVVCTRIITGVSESISIGYRGLRLQKWEERRLWGLWGKGFYDVEHFPRTGAAGEVKAAVGLLRGAVVDGRLPLSGQPALPGRYRVCFSYAPSNQEKYQDLCSEEFSLP